MAIRAGRRTPRIPTIAVLVAVASTAGAILAPIPVAALGSPPGTLSLVAGGPGSGGALGVSQLPTSLAVGPGGSVYVGDAEGYVRSLAAADASESTVAGSGPFGSTVSGDPAPVSSFGTGYVGGTSAQPVAELGAAVDRSGDVVVADQVHDTVRVVARAAGSHYGRTMTAGRVYTIVGTNDQQGAPTDGQPGTAALLTLPADVTVDGSGDIVVADTGNDEVRVLAASTGRHFGRMMTAGDVYTVAGDGTAGSVARGQPGTAAQLDQPTSVSLAAGGGSPSPTPAATPSMSWPPRSGTYYGIDMVAGSLYTVAGTGVAGTGVAGGNGDGGAGAAAELSDPNGVGTDRQGDLYIADTGDHRVRVVAAAAGTVSGLQLAAGEIATVVGSGTDGSSPPGTAADAARLSEPVATAVDSAGNLLVADAGTASVAVVAARTTEMYGHTIVAGDLYPVAGDGRIDSSGDAAPAAQAEDNQPFFVSTAPDGDIAYAEVGGWGPGNDRSSGYAASRIRVVAAHDETRFGIAMLAGDVYTVAGGATQPPPGPRAGDGGIATGVALLGPVSATYDQAGNLVTADPVSGLLQVVAATSGSYYGRAMVAGDIYTVAGSPTGTTAVGIPATSAALASPMQVAVDPSGNLVFAQSQGPVVSVVAVRTGRYYGQSMVAGDIYTICGRPGAPSDTGDGGPASAATIGEPYGVAIDASGDIAVGSPSDQLVRMIAATTGTHLGVPMVAGDIYTVAGDQSALGAGNGGPARSASVRLVAGLAFTADGSLVLCGFDQVTALAYIRVVAASAGTRFGIAMGAGDIYSVAGDGSSGLTVDGGPATASALGVVDGVAVAPTGDLLFTDYIQGTVQRISGP